MRGKQSKVVRILRFSVKAFIEHTGLQTGAALAYYALLSLAPLLLIVVSLASIFFANDTVRIELIGQIERLIGSDGAALAETVLSNATGDTEDGMSLTIGTFLLLIGASTVFAQLQNALNRLWAVEAAPERAWLGFLRHRLLSLALVLTIGFLLLVSLAFDATLAAMQSLWNIGNGEAFVLQLINRITTFVLAMLLMVLMLRYLPDADVRWRSVWLGAAMTTLLFTLGKSAIGAYLGQASIGSWFGAAGSVVVFMIWIYYASIVFLFGAAITKSVATVSDETPSPVDHARASPAN
jgi:membrane protein